MSSPCLLLTRIAAQALKKALLNSLCSPGNIKIITHVNIYKNKDQKILMQIKWNVSFSFFNVMLLQLTCNIIPCMAAP